ncbi:universal stress protein [bacterium]|nr:universal stress protein [bacterium]
MYRKIMVPLDGSPVAEAALYVACQLLEPGAGELVLVRMLENSRRAGAPEELESNRCESYLQIVAAHWFKPGRSVRVEVLRPGPRIAPVLHEAALRHECEVVVMTSHGRTGLDRRLAGSVAEELARRCSRPVLILGPQTPEVCRIKQELRQMSATTEPPGTLGNRLSALPRAF